MSVAALLESLRQRNIEVWAEGGQLRCQAPAGAIDAELREELRQRKGDIVKFLQAAQTLATQQTAIIPLQPAGTLPPVFAVPGHSGDVFCFNTLARQLGKEQPFFGLQPPGLEGNDSPPTSIEALAGMFSEQIRTFYPSGPLVIAGYCAGGTVAFELARQLGQQGRSIEFIALFGAPYPTWYRFLPQTWVRLKEQAARVKKHLQAFRALPWNELTTYIADKRKQRRERHEVEHQVVADPMRLRRTAVERSTLAAVRHYTPQYFDGRVTVFLPNNQWQRTRDRLLSWPVHMARQVDEYCGPESCNGYNMLLEPHAATFADLFRKHGIQSGSPIHDHQQRLVKQP